MLPVDGRAAHLEARLRLAAIAGSPPAVRMLVDEFAVSTRQEYTDKVLPPLVDPVVGRLDPGWSSGIGSAFTSDPGMSSASPPRTIGSRTRTLLRRST